MQLWVPCVRSEGVWKRNVTEGLKDMIYGLLLAFSRMALGQKNNFEKLILLASHPPVATCLVKDVINHKLRECKIANLVFLDKPLDYTKVVVINSLETGIIQWCVSLLCFIKAHAHTHSY